MVHILPGRPVGKPDQMSPTYAAVPSVASVGHRTHCVDVCGWPTTAQGVTPGQWRHVRAALVAVSGQGCCLPRAAVGLGTPSLSGDCSTR